MSDVLVLVAILAAYYAQDCSLWLPRDAVVFFRGLRGWRPHQPHPLLSGRAKGIVLSFRLPPLAPVYVCPGRSSSTGRQTALSPGALERDLERFAERALHLRLLCNALFVYCFCTLPAAMLLWSLTVLWPVLLAALAVLVLSIAFGFWRLHTSLWPADASIRRSELAHMLLYPPAAMRAHDHLAHRVCVPYHPLTAAAVLCRPDVFAAFAAGELRRMLHPLATETAPTRDEIAAVHDMLRRQNLRPGDLLQAPPADATSRAFCPRCLAAYAVAEGDCADCPGVGLVPHVPDVEPAATAPAAVQELR
jgi:hypothetical protein